MGKCLVTNIFLLALTCSIDSLRLHRSSVCFKTLCVVRTIHYWPDLVANFHAKGAAWDATAVQECIPDTRVALLESIVKWAYDAQSEQVYWLYGVAGSGKTTVAKTIARTVNEADMLGASFFCSRAFEERKDIKSIFVTIASQLASRNPLFCQEVMKVFNENPRMRDTMPSEQLKKLLVEPFQKLPSSSKWSVVIVIDALDECDDENSTDTILSLLRFNLQSLPFKFFITSRPEPRIRSQFERVELRSRTNSFCINAIERSDVDSDIRRFIDDELSRSKMQDIFPDIPTETWTGWPLPKQVDGIVTKSAGLFIYASTACKFIKSGNPFENMENLTSSVLELDPTDFKAIDSLYSQVIGHAIRNFGRTKIAKFRLILGFVILVSEPLSLAGLAQLTGYPRPDHVRAMLEDMHSVLIIPKEETGLVQPFHASLHDYLTDEERCVLDKFPFLQPSFHHGKIVCCLFQCLSRLQKNICRINNSDHLRSNRDIHYLATNRDKYLDETLAYACRFWADHLSLAAYDSDSLIIELLQTFVTNQLLYWIEALSLLGNLGIGVVSMQKARRWLPKSVSTCNKWVYPSSC